MAVQDKDKLVSLEDLKTAYDDLDGDVSDLKNTLNHKADVIYDTASGDIASFPDGAEGLPVKDLTVAIEPVQDLHGYDHPWPAGGGKNLFNPPSEPFTQNDVTITGNADGSVTLSGTAASGAFLFFAPLPYDIPAGTNVTFSLNNTDTDAKVGARLTDVASGSTSTYGTMVLTDAANKTATVSESFIAKGINVFVRANHDAVSITLKIQCEIGSTATAWTPYSNICPISGRTGANVTRAGKNLCPNAFYPYGLSSDYTITKNADGSVSLTGTYTSTSNAVIRNAFFTLPAGSYILSGMLGKEWVGLSLQLQKPVTSTVIGYAGYIYNLAFTIAETTQLEARIFIAGATAKDVPLDNYTICPMIIRQDETDTSFEGYQGTVYPIIFPVGTTVYGGTLELPSCVLMVDKAIVDMGMLNWSAVGNPGTTNYRWSSTLSGISPASGPEVAVDAICENYPVAPWEWLDREGHDKFVCALPGYNLLCVRDTTYSDATTFKSAMNGVKFVYKLAQPQTYQLTPTEITTLLGTNNIWADCGPVSVDYPADTKLYIDKKLAALVAALS